MADNVTADPGTGGATFRTDDDGTAHWPYVKLAWGADNTQTILDSGASAIPIQDGGNAITVDGTVAVTNAGLTELAAAINASSQMDVNIAASNATITVASHAVTNAGTFAVQVDNAVTVASHAVTNAGTFAVQVDGSALTALQLIDDAVFAEDVAAQAADKGIAILAVRRDADTSLVGTDNDYANLQVDANGYLKVEIFDGGDSHTVDNAGTFVVQENGAALTALQRIDNSSIGDDSVFTPVTDGVNMAGFFCDETAPDSVNEHDGGAARITPDRRIYVVPTPHTQEGLSIMRSIDLDESEETVKTSAGAIYAMWVTNTATSTRFVKFYDDTVANVSVGTTVPVITIGIPGNSSDDISGVFNTGGMGVPFATAITVAATTGVADNDTGAPGANEVVVNIFFK